MKSQTLEEHCRNVQLLAKTFASKKGMKSIASLAGVLHDMGKACKEFQIYLKWSAQHPYDFSKRGSVYHSPTGAIFAYDRWYEKRNPIEQITAQIISMAIRGHHGGLLDCVSPDGISVYLNSIGQEKEKLYFEEAASNFMAEIASSAELDFLFEEACQEVESLLIHTDKKDRAFVQGMLTRLLLSVIVDADRWDTVCFKNKENPFQDDEKANWCDLASRLEKKLLSFEKDSEIGGLRSEISIECANTVKDKGIYTLTIPTGGGKTLSSLRFALLHAMGNNIERIFFIIPFNTILEQNSEDIKAALGGYEGILEHYGTFFSDLEGEEGEVEENEHQLLTERWNVPIIMTSIVQFLNSLFRAENSNTRRMHRLSNSILIFDEIQALPKHCTVLFEKAIQFLTNILNCTVLLCTATQPNLSVKAESLLSDKFVSEIFNKLKRIRLINESDKPRDNAKAAEDIAALAEKNGSLLVIVNTKKVAFQLFDILKNMDLPVECIHLSTNMCPAHRLKKINEMKEMLRKKEKNIICISTMLIEAGVNISFPCVVRSLSGLPSIMQAAGRCNRNMEIAEKGVVYIWHFSEESLGSLREIRKGQECTWSVIEKIQNENSLKSLESQEAMKWFFEKERISYDEQTLQYLWKGQKNINVTLTEMLERNQIFRIRTDFEIKRGSRYGDIRFFQAFSTAGHTFRVIDEDTIAILVPYGEGKDLIAKLCSEQTLKDRIRTLRRSQYYSVSVWRSTYEKLNKENALFPVGETGEFSLLAQHYDEELGLIMKPKEMEYLGY